jgi:hypothetical protein
MNPWDKGENPEIATQVQLTDDYIIIIIIGSTRV